MTLNLPEGHSSAIQAWGGAGLGVSPIRTLALRALTMAGLTQGLQGPSPTKVGSKTCPFVACSGDDPDLYESPLSPIANSAGMGCQQPDRGGEGK